MKTAIKRLGSLATLGLVVGILAPAQHVLAQDTTAGTDITNQATVSFSVGGVAQAPASSNAYSFVVDRRVDFDVSLEAGAVTPATPGQTGLFLPFVVTNESNDTLDFDLAQSPLANGVTFRGGGETATGETMDAVSIEVAAAIMGSGGSETPTRGANINGISSLGPGEAIRVYIFSDAPLTLPDGSTPAMELSVTAAQGGSPLVDNSGVADDPAAVQNVFVNPPVGGNAVLTNADGFSVTAADVTAVKSSAVISDPFSSSNPKAIPDAIVEYTITVTNNGTETASTPIISDTLNIANVEFVTDAYGAGQNVDLGGGSFCNADGDAGDGCEYDPGTGGLDVQIGDLAPGGGTQTITFRVRIR